MKADRLSAVAEAGLTLFGALDLAIGLESWSLIQIVLALAVILQAVTIRIWRRQAREWQALYRQEIRSRRVAAGVVIPPGDGRL